MSRTRQLYDELVAELKKTATLSSCASLLSWDEQTYLPAGGAEHRAAQLSLLAGIVHRRATAPRIGELLGELETSGGLGEEDSPTAVNVREARRSYDRATKLPQELVEELSRVTSLAQQAWVRAKKESDFPGFRTWLEKIVALKREEAQAIGHDEGGVLYDALLDDYEPRMKSDQVQSVFEPLRDELVQLVGEITGSGRRPDVSILERRYPVEAQREFAKEAAGAIGFDFHRGRLDVAPHPFCSGIGPGDCRLTTRYNERHFPGAFFGVLHEAGHGMYEQGLDPQLWGTPMGDSVSLGIHESQSLTWEDWVGGSRGFWRRFYEPAQKAFPEALGGVAFDDFYFAINDVRPTYIRVEADEVTYSLHIMLRFELEQKLLTGDLPPGDVPGVWNKRFEEYLGIGVPDDARGCLQDIHWSGGLVGYFPTYALGKLYAAQFFEAAKAELGDLEEMFSRGEFAPLKEWLNRNIHRRGMQYPANRLVEVVTGEPLSHRPFIEHLRRKYGELYAL